MKKSIINTSDDICLGVASDRSSCGTTSGLGVTRNGLGSTKSVVGNKAREDIKLKARATAFKKGTIKYVQNSKKNKQALISARRKVQESKPEESEDESETEEAEEAEEQRYDADNRIYTEDEFFDKYGDGGQKKWDEAPTIRDFEKEAERELEAMDVDALA